MCRLGCSRATGGGLRAARDQAEADVSPLDVSTTTRGLLELTDWLAAHEVTHVAMEATGSYWKPVWHILEGHRDLTLANAQHVRNVPGRKSDVNDARWLADLLAVGLLRAGFVPPTPVQELRDLTRTRKQLVREIGRHTQRRQKILEDANIKPAETISDIRGQSGRAVLRTLIGGKPTPNAWWRGPTGSKRRVASFWTRSPAESRRITASCSSCTSTRSRPSRAD